jgi:hypothetical protein
MPVSTALAWAAIARLLDDDNVGGGFPDVAQDGERTVRARVIDVDDFKIEFLRRRARRDRLMQGTQRRFRIKHWNDQAHLGPRGDRPRSRGGGRSVAIGNIHFTQTGQIYGTRKQYRFAISNISFFEGPVLQRLRAGAPECQPG